MNIDDFFKDQLAVPVLGYITRDGWLQILCPFCGMLHHHGTDGEEFSPTAIGPVLGPRYPHCEKRPRPTRSYDILEVMPYPMPDALRKIATANRRRFIKATEKNRQHEYEPHWPEWCIFGWMPEELPPSKWTATPFDTPARIDPKWLNKTVIPGSRRHTWKIRGSL
jgi:hypothetical protein